MMLRAIRILSSALLAVGLSGPGTAFAHHSLAQFDRAKTVTLNGVVKHFDWANPHVYIELITDNGGMPMEWSVEGGTPTTLSRGGWRPSIIKPGDKISVGIHPRKDGTANGFLADEEPLVVNGHALISAVSIHAANGGD